MGWFDYYTLLEKYNGDLTMATAEEMSLAALYNPNDPPTARRIAEEQWKRDRTPNSSCADGSGRDE